MSTLATTDWSKLSGEAVKEVFEWIKGAKDFVAEQAPMLVNEVISWGFWSHFVIGSIAFIFFITTIVCFFKSVKGLMSGEPYIAGIIVSFIIGGIALGMALYNLYMCLYVYFAPRMYLIEYFKELV